MNDTLLFTFHYGSSQTHTCLCQRTDQIQFTFHYGSSQTLQFAPFSNSASVFTFHYGSSQTCVPHLMYRSLKYIYIPLWFFSNSVTLYVCLFTNYLHSTMVLLKQGFDVCSSRNNWIYIPLWFFSNFSFAILPHILSFIYIPLWFFSNLLPFFQLF